MMPSYEIFDPPIDLDFDGWSRKEAREYFDWFIAEIPVRVSELRRVTDGRCELDFSPDSLLCLDEFLGDHIETSPRSADEIARIRRTFPAHLAPHIEINEWELTDRCISLAVDIAIYFAETLRRACNGVEWVLWTRRSIEFQRPVVAVRDRIPLDPILIVTNITLGKARGTERAGVLREVFDIWRMNLCP